MKPMDAWRAAVWRRFCEPALRGMDVLFWGTIVAAVAYICVYSRSWVFFCGNMFGLVMYLTPAAPGYLLAAVQMGVLYGARSGAGSVARRWSGAMGVWNVCNIIIYARRRAIIAVLDAIWCALFVCMVIVAATAAYPVGHARNPVVGYVHTLSFTYGAAAAYRAAEDMFG